MAALPDAAAGTRDRWRSVAVAVGAHRVVRDGGMDERERAGVVDPATGASRSGLGGPAAGSRVSSGTGVIAGDRAVGDDESAVVVDPSAVPGIDSGTAGSGSRSTSGAAAVSASTGAIVGDRDAVEDEVPVVQDAAAVFARRPGLPVASGASQ